jgi:hypothetical protein
MRISFDLDDTLFVNKDMVKVEKELRFPYKYFYQERLRYGTIDLLKKIIDNKIDLWIYTTSFRSPMYIKNYFNGYGIKIKSKNIVNGDRHMKEIQGNRNEILPSKYPVKYKIDLHIDDDISVKQNGDQYGFKVFLINDNMTNWADEIWESIIKIKSTLENKTGFSGDSHF